MSSRPGLSVPPQVLALLTADAIARDADTGKYHLRGIYNALRPPSYPATHTLRLYLALSGRGTPAVGIRVLLGSDAADPDAADHVIVESTPRGLVTFPGPFEPQETQIVIPALPLPREGVYRIQVLWDGDVLFERTLVAAPAGGPKAG